MAAPKAAPEMKDAIAAHAHTQINTGQKVLDLDNDEANSPLFKVHWITNSDSGVHRRRPARLGTRNDRRPLSPADEIA